MSEALKIKEHPAYFEEQAQADDIHTWLSEVLDGQMRTEFTYQFNGQDLIARDGRPLKPIFENAIVDAEEKSTWNPELDFELRRRKIELGEYEDMLAMAKGDSRNTMIVISDFPPELMYKLNDTCGYNVARKQTMLRVINRNEDGSITTTSQSLDGSDRASLEAIYDFFGEVPKSGELLSQRIYANVDPVFQKTLTDTLTRVYDRTMSMKYGKDYFAGRDSQDRRNTMEFAVRQRDLIDAYLAGPKDENSQFNLAAAITARFERGHILRLEACDNVKSLGSCLSPILEMEIQGRLAAKQNKEFSGCGVSISMDLSAESELEKLGYGDEDKKSGDDGKMRCVNCPECKEFHDEVRVVKGKPVCDNPDCKLSDRKK